MIIGFAELIMQTPGLYGRKVSPKVLADLHVILSNSQHLSNLINDVLDLSQIDAGHMTISLARCSLTDAVEAAAVAVLPLCESKGLYLCVHVSRDLPPVFCDATRIRQVELNVLSPAPIAVSWKVPGIVLCSIPPARSPSPIMVSRPFSHAARSRAGYCCEECGQRSGLHDCAWL